MNKNGKIVFIGDSITEWGCEEDPENIGTGYVRLIHDYLVTTYPERKPVVLNRGVGGNRIPDLAKRWQKDVLDENPDYVSVSIGINDVWRQIDHLVDDQVYPDQFEQIYVDLLTQLKEKSNAKIIIMEPTIIEEDVHSEANKKLVAYVDVVKRLAERFEAIYVPTNQAFIHFLNTDADLKLTIDGVHTNSTGNMLIAQTWIKAFEENVMQFIKNF